LNPSLISATTGGRSTFNATTKEEIKGMEEF